MANFRFFSGSGGSGDKIVLSTTINENVSAGDVLRSKVAGAHGLVEKADDLGVQAVGVASDTGTIGNSINVVFQGNQQVNFIETLTSSDIGKRVYVSSTSGKATITPPTAAGKSIIQLGTLRATDGTCYVNPLTILKL